MRSASQDKSDGHTSPKTKADSSGAEEFERELDELIGMDSKTPILALRTAFCLGARVALGLQAKQRQEAKIWLDEQVRICMHEVGNYERRR